MRSMPNSRCKGTTKFRYAQNFFALFSQRALLALLSLKSQSACRAACLSVFFLDFLWADFAQVVE